MSMSDRDGKIWFDGQLIDWRDAKIHVLSHSLHYGLSVFEGVRAYDTEGDELTAQRVLTDRPAALQLTPSEYQRRTNRAA